MRLEARIAHSTKLCPRQARDEKSHGHEDRNGPSPHGPLLYTLQVRSVRLQPDWRAAYVVAAFSRTWPQPAHKSRARRVASNLWCRSERVIEIVVSDLPAQATPASLDPPSPGKPVQC